MYNFDYSIYIREYIEKRSEKCSKSKVDKFVALLINQKNERDKRQVVSYSDNECDILSTMTSFSTVLSSTLFLRSYEEYEYI